MGQCYDVNLRVRFKDKEGAKNALRKKISRSEEEHVCYFLPQHGERKFNLSDLWDLMSIFFGGWDGIFHSPDDWEKNRPIRAEGVWIWSGFNASYVWEHVMIDAFDKIAPFLEDGYVENGEVIWQQ